MKVIVTGGAGFIGSAVVRTFVDRHRAQVAVFDNMTYAANPQTLSVYRKRPDFTFYQRDICDVDAVRSAISEFQPDAVVHLAAESHVDRSIDKPAQFVATNVVGTQVLLDASLAYWRELAGPRKDAFRCFMAQGTICWLWGTPKPTFPAASIRRKCFG